MNNLLSRIRNYGQSQDGVVTLIVVCALVGAVGFNLWHLFPETTGGGVPLNDRRFHLALVDSAVSAITNGQNITDPWQGTMSLGFPVFHYYQHLPHVFLALVHVLSFKVFTTIDLLRWTIYLGLSLFPISIYWSLRRFSFDPLTCAMGALVASLIGNDFQLYGGFGYVNYSFSGFGLYTQLWGMVLLPIALALGYQTIRTGQGYFWATLFLSVTLMSHLLYGYMAFVTLGFLAFIPNPDIKSSVQAIFAHWERLLLVFGLVVCVTLYFTVPFLLDQEHYGHIAANIKQTPIDSFGFQVVLEALVKGDLFDLGRFPSVSILILGGIGSCIFYRRESRYLVPILIFVIWLLLFFGRTTWGSAIDLLPFSQNIHMHRFIGGVHLGGIFLAAAALAVPLRWAVTRGNKWYIAAVLLLTLVLLAPVYVERRTYLSANAAQKQENQAGLRAEQADMDNLIKTLRALPPGRVYAGSLTVNDEGRGRGWGYKIGPVPVAFILGAAGFDTFSATLHRYSLISNALGHFDESNPHHYNLFNIRYAVLPKDSHGSFLEPVEQIGRHEIFKVETTGYFDLVGSKLEFEGSAEAYMPRLGAWLTSGFPKAKLHPQVSIDGSPKIRNEGTRNSTVVSENLESTDPSFESVNDLDSYIAQVSNGPTRGSVISEDVGTNYYSTRVNVERESMLMLKVAYHPNWRATVDGVDAETFMLMPGFPAVQLGPGEHNIMMEYESGNLRKVLLGFGFLALVSIGILERRGATVSASLKSSVLVSVLSSMKLRDNRSGSRSSRRRRDRRNR